MFASSLPSNLKSAARGRRKLLLSGVAALAVATGTTAQAGVAILTEGRPTIQGDVNLTSDDDRLYVNILRAGADGSLNLGVLGDNTALATGTVNTNGGDDMLWLMADGTQSKSLIVAPPGSKIAEFTGGIGYYSRGADSQLTLDPTSPGATYTSTLHLAGEGTVTVNSDIQVLGDHAIMVEPADVGPGIDLRLTGVIDGNFNPLGIPDFGFVDAAAARRVELAAGSSISLIRGTALIAARSGETIIGNGAEIVAKDSTVSTNPNQNAILVSAQEGGTVVNLGWIREQGDPDAQGQESEATISTGVLLGNGAVLRNGRTSATNFGRIEMHGNAVVIGGDATVINEGLIQSDMRAAISSANANEYRAMVRNLAGGTIQGVAKDSQNEIESFTTAYEGGEGTDVVVNGGTINGDVSLGGGSDAFLAVADANGNPTGQVNGAIDGGEGERDAFGRSFSSSGTYTASNAMLTGTVGVTGFERHGIEADGLATTATFTAAETLTNGLTLFGNGTVVNRADITTVGTEGIIADEFANGLDFVNEAGAVVSTTDHPAFFATGNSLSSFVNHGTLASEGGFAAVAIEVAIADNATFDLVNSGQIVGNGPALYADISGRTDAGADLRVTNSGSISSSNGIAVGARSEEGAVTLVNSGTIEGGDWGVFVVGQQAGVQNSGEISTTGSGSASLHLAANDIAVTNNGLISANVGGSEGMLTAALSINQSSGGAAHVINGSDGVIEATGNHSVAVVAFGLQSEFTLQNSGRIVGSGQDSTSGEDQWAGGVFLSNTPVVASAIHTAATVDTIINSGAGVIVGNVDLGGSNDRFEARGTSQLQGDLRLGFGDDTLLLAGGSITGLAQGGDGQDRLLINLDQDRSVVGDNFSSFETIVRDGTGTGILTASGSFDIDTLNLDGMTVRVAANSSLTTQGDVTLTGSDNAERLIVEGTIAGAVRLGGGNDRVEFNGGSLADLSLGEGDDYVDLSNGGTVLGLLSGGEGNDTIGFLLTADAGTEAIPAGAESFESLDVRGNHTLTLDQAFDTVSLREGADLIVTADAGTIANINGDNSDQTVLVEGQLTGGVSLGGGTDRLTLMAVSGTISDAMDGGDGMDSLILNLTGATEFSNGAQGFESILVTGSSPLTISGAFGAGQLLTFGDDANQLVIGSAASFAGTANGGGGVDTLTVNTTAPDSRSVVSAQIQNFEVLNANGNGTLALLGENYDFDQVTVNGGNLVVGAGTILHSDAGVLFADGADNRLSLASAASISGVINAGDGIDTLALQQGQGLVRSLSSVNGYQSFERLESSGTGELRIDANAAFDAVTLDGGTTTVAAGATLTANVQGSGNADIFVILGTLNGDVNLGGGNDRLVITSLDTMTGLGAGGDGIDTLDFRAAGTAAAPTEFNGLGFGSFESLAVSSGVVSLVASTSWTDVNVTGGRLIGQAGTTLTSEGTIDVAHGATFGSAGTVNADINVLGTLSPGASPGTMTVNGDVTMAAGSNLLIELTPSAGRDLLDVNGTLTIASGAAMDITGALGNSPGSVIDIVTADTITGRFTTINKSATVFGFVVQNGNRIQIRSEFSSSGDYPTNVQASVDYANQVLRAGYGVQAFTGALNVLTAADGTINQTAFAQLTPEAYGSAMELGTNTALNVIDATRSVKVTAPIEDGFYGFAQVLAGNHKIGGQADTGAASARFDAEGYFGGIGYGMGGGKLQVGAFLGKTLGDQKLSQLDARTDADGMLVGAFADASFGRLGVHGLVAYSDTDAKTVRNMLVGEAATGDYRLKTWFADASIDYRVDLGSVTVAPRAGLSYVDVKRTAVAEDGAGDFSLLVGSDRRSGWFADASVSVSGRFALGGIGVAPYAEVGLRHLLNDGGHKVSGRFIGAPGDPITVSGVERDETQARFGTGFALDLSKKVRFDAGYTGEFKDFERSTVTARATIRF